MNTKNRSRTNTTGMEHKTHNVLTTHTIKHEAMNVYLVPVSSV